MDKQPVGTRRTTMYGILLVLGSVLFSAAVVGVLGEVLLNIIDIKHEMPPGRPKNVHEMWVPDSVLGYRNKPGFTLTPKYWWGCDEAFTSKGTRGPEFAAKKPENTYRILGLGDSVGLGIGVCDEKTFLRKLEKNLNADSEITGKVEVINAGTLGYSSMQEYLFLVEYGQYWNPDLVIVTICPNDNVPSEDPFGLKKFVEPWQQRRKPSPDDGSKKKSDDSVNNETSENFFKTILGKSKLLRSVINGIDYGFYYLGWVRKNPLYEGKVSENRKHPERNWYQYFYLLNRYPKVLDTFANLIRFCEEKKIDLIIINIPFSITLYRRVITENNAAIKLFEDNGVDYLDFYDIFEKTIFKKKFFMFYKPEIYLHEDILHLNEFGHNLVEGHLRAMVKKHIARTGRLGK